ncbi:hypothetical protein [Limnohabitans sp.]|uniref:hypothetical protein n=1 Tax=Limnohabitans sp. TaxID=1907725 RepID=UPI0037C04538
MILSKRALHKLTRLLAARPGIQERFVAPAERPPQLPQPIEHAASDWTPTNKALSIQIDLKKPRIGGAERPSPKGQAAGALAGLSG